MTELTFIDELPIAAGGSAKTKERASEIRTNSPRWAQWPSQTPPTAVQKALDKIGDGFEVVGRKCEDGKTRAFVRFAPQESMPASNGNGAGKVGPPPPQFRRHARRSSARRAHSSPPSTPARTTTRHSLATSQRTSLAGPLTSAADLRPPSINR